VAVCVRARFTRKHGVTSCRPWGNVSWLRERVSSHGGPVTQENWRQNSQRQIAQHLDSGLTITRSRDKVVRLLTEVTDRSDQDGKLRQSG